MAHLLPYTELEKLEAVLASQELLAFESVDISTCLGDEFDKSVRFRKPTTANEIEQRERDNSKENSTKYRVVGKRPSSLNTETYKLKLLDRSISMFCFRLLYTEHTN